MSRATPQMRDLARRLIAIEAHGSKSSEAEAMAHFQVIEKLRPNLATLMGNAGFRALLSRSLALACADIPKLHGVKINPEGSLDGLAQAEALLSAQEISEGRTIILAHLLALLVAFIGANLTYTLIRETWPNLTPDDLNFNKGRKN